MGQLMVTQEAEQLKIGHLVWRINFRTCISTAGNLKRPLACPALDWIDRASPVLIQSAAEGPRLIFLAGQIRELAQKAWDAYLDGNLARAEAIFETALPVSDDLISVLTKARFSVAGVTGPGCSVDADGLLIPGKKADNSQVIQVQK